MAPSPPRPADQAKKGPLGDTDPRLVIGLVVGLLARLLKPGRDRMGLIMTTLLGIAGALLAGWFGRTMGWYARQGSRQASFRLARWTHGSRTT